jgi:2-polyprenyl-3-methyl-5-hydroxy-6-metoxy-1,4-benzoquinol methylase
MAGSFEAFYRSGGATAWERGKADVVRQVADLLMDLSPSSRILDFGCGTGWTAPILTAKGGRYLGIDPSREGITIAEREYSGTGIHFNQMKIGEPLEGALARAQFTHIFALDTLHFVADIEGTLESIHTSLEPGGLLVMISHLYRELLSGIQWCTLLHRNGYTSVRRYRFFDREAFDPAVYGGQPEESIELAREIYEHEGALVVTGRRP